MVENLKLQALAIGSLPHSNPDDAMKLVEKDFSQIPFYPQLANVNKNEDMLYQYLEGMPGFQSEQSFVLDLENEELISRIEEFYIDYEEIISDIDSEKLEKYGISKNHSSTFPLFTDLIKKTKPQYAKGQVIGAFTLASSLTDKDGKSLIYDETFRDIIVKLISLKALWQIKQIKTAYSDCTPIIFMDEPTISQLGTSAYMTIDKEEIVNILSEISDVIKQNNALSAVHCCGKCDWSIPLKTNVDIINMDAYNFSQNFSIYPSQIKEFLLRGGKIAWGLVPTMSDEILKDLTVEDLVLKFEQSVNYLTKKGIDEKLIIDNSLITSSCGAGALSVKGATKAMDLVSELSNTLKERYKI